MSAETPAPEKLDMLTGLHEIAERRHLARQHADLVFAALPEGVREFKVTRGSGSRQLFYELPGLLNAGGMLAWGNQRNTRSLDRLFECIMTCALRLDRRSTESVFAQLGNASKHLDFMHELDVVLGIPDAARIDHEVPLLDGVRKTVDWQIMPPRGPIILLDVKARVADLIDHLEKIGTQIGDGRLSMDKVGPTDARPLFRSLGEKFPARTPGLFLQGAWINVNIKHQEQLYVDAFDALDPAKVHFALIVTEGRKAYVLKRDGVNVEYLRSVLRFEESRDAIMEA